MFHDIPGFWEGNRNCLDGGLGTALGFSDGINDTEIITVFLQFCKKAAHLLEGRLSLYISTISMYDSFALWMDKRANDHIECMANCALSVNMEISRVVIRAGKRHENKCRSLPCFSVSHRSQSATEHHPSATDSQQKQLCHIHSA